MSTTDKNLPLELAQAIQLESEKFQEYYLWLEQAMPKVFFEEISQESLTLITHSLIGFHLQNYFCTINLKSAAIVICLDSPDADLRILHGYSLYGIKNYQAYVSKTAAPFPGIQAPLRIATIDFTEALESADKSYSPAQKTQLRQLLKQENPEISDQEFEELIAKTNVRFLLSMPPERLALALHMLFRAQSRDNCQYEVRYEDKWAEKKGASMNIVLAWRNTPKHHFLYRLAKVVRRHGLKMTRVNATYTDPYHSQSVLVMALSLHGSNEQSVWDVADIPDFLRELVTVKYFDTADMIYEELVSKGIVSGNVANLLRAMQSFIHQALVHLDPNLYTVEHVEEALCRHPELTQQIYQAFKYKFDPHHVDIDKFFSLRKQFLAEVAQLDTGQEANDMRRKNVLRQAMNFVTYTLKTNFYRINYTSLSFRLDPKYLDEIPFDRGRKFPELPYAIFFVKGMHFLAFHIRFKDLARGGVRTVYPDLIEHMVAERNNIFTECYNLAWTQHKKNKDIPEAGAKGVIFIKPFAKIDLESQILRKELERAKIDAQLIENKIAAYRQEQKIEYLYQAQRSFIEALVTLVNCNPDGTIRARFIVDYWKRPEYLYLGPDENMHDFMIQWIANYSQRYHYKPGAAFISSKPIGGINHKEYGVTSLGVNVYMHHTLQYLGINPNKDAFTVKLSGGPDGDVAGNQLLNLQRFYPDTAKVVALTDKTGTIFDEKGLDLNALKELFLEGKGICFYAPEKLSPGGFLVNKESKRYPTPYVQETLCWKNKDGHLTEEWLGGSDTNHLLRYNVHQAHADIFIPAGGRPRTLNETNIKEFLDETGHPTAKAIIEGANLYLTPAARHFLEEKGVLIIKDSSANKTGVICSSFEVICGLALNETTFIENKEQLVNEILERLKQCAENEAQLLLRTHQQTGIALTALSDKISQQINQYTYQILDYLDPLPLPSSKEDPMLRCFLSYCLPTLRDRFTSQLLDEIPDHHKKAIIACYLAAHIVYTKGIDWSPSIIDIFPLILAENPS
jgi:glutamate dehydrogenase